MTPLWNPLSFMGGLPAPAQEALLKVGWSRTVQGGETLIWHGEQGTTAYLVLTGRMNVTITVPNGTESLLGIRHAGDLVGEMAMLGDGCRSATVTARERSTVLVLPAADLRRFLAQHPEATLKLGDAIGQRLNQANAYRADAAGYDVEVRLARALLYQGQRLARREGGHLVVDLRQAELGMLIGAKEGTVQKALRGATLGRLVKCRRGRVILLEVEELARLAEIGVPKELA